MRVVVPDPFFCELIILGHHVAHHIQIAKQIPWRDHDTRRCHAIADRRKDRVASRQVRNEGTVRPRFAPRFARRTRLFQMEWHRPLSLAVK